MSGFVCDTCSSKDTRQDRQGARTASDIERKYSGTIASLNDGYSELSYTMDGLTVKDGAGTTRIKGSSIDTTTLNAKSITADKLNITGAITFADLADSLQSTIDNAAPRYQYSTDGYNWHSTMSPSFDKYRRESYDGGKTWGEGYLFNGSTSYNSIKNALAAANNAAMTIITGTSVDTVDIHANNIYAGAADSVFCSMTNEGFKVYHTNSNDPKAAILTDPNGQYISLVLGAGDTAYNDVFRIIKMANLVQIAYTTPSGTQSGFRFNADGSIDVLGKLNT